MHQKQTIAIVANSGWNIYNYRQNLLRAFYKKNYRCIIIAPDDGYIQKIDPQLFDKYISLQTLFASSINPIKEIKLLREFYKIYKKEQPDLILHYTIKPNIIGNLAARLTKIPSISTLTGLGYTFINPSTFTSLLRWFYKFALKHPSQVIFHNNEDKNIFVKANLVPAHTASVIKGSGVDIEFFKKTNSKNLAAKQKNNKLIFLFVGRLLHDKGIGEFIFAAHEIPHAEFWIIGGLGENNPAVVSTEQLDKWLSDQKNIKYFGAQSDVKNFYQKADVFVLPSYREGMPKAVLEAMAMGMPIITTNTAGCNETVEERRNGFLIPIKDTDELILAIQRMLSLNKAELETMGIYSREKAVKEFADEVVVEQYLQMIATLFKLQADVRY